MKIKIINSLAAAALLTGSLGVLQAEKAKSTDAKPAKAKAAFTKYSFAALSRAYGEICDKDVAYNRGKVAKTKGHKILSFPQADIEAMQEKFKGIEASWVKSTPDGAKILAAMKAELAKVRAMKK